MSMGQRYHTRNDTVPYQKWYRRPVLVWLTGGYHSGTFEEAVGDGEEG
jgi:hypothetical protein